MKTSHYWIQTQRDVTQEAVTPSHRLMLRAGMVRSSGAGSYSWLPLGMRVLNKLTALVRARIDAVGGQEILMPSLQNADLWERSGRLEPYGPELFRLFDRNQKPMLLAPTNEEFVSSLVKGRLRSPAQLPTLLYQIQTKFRDEKRPRAGVMRAKEFLMKDAYSFHTSTECLEETYQSLAEAYQTLFEDLDLKVLKVCADPGNIGGHESHEFHALTPSGEDRLAHDPVLGYLANLEVVPTFPLNELDQTARSTWRPGSPQLLWLVNENPSADPTPLVLHPEATPNLLKLAKIPGILKPPRILSEPQRLARGATLPPCLDALIAEWKGPIYADHTSRALKSAPQLELAPQTVWGDYRYARTGDPTPCRRGRIRLQQGLEVGHIFKLGLRYSRTFGATFRSAEGQEIPLLMGCYGLGLSRLVAAVIEQHHDERGLLWPEALAPFSVAIVPLNAHRAPEILQAAHTLYESLQQRGVEVLLEDRPERPGVLLSDVELIGIPHVFIIGNSYLENQTLEYRHRSVTKPASAHIPLSEVGAFLQSQGVCRA